MWNEKKRVVMKLWGEFFCFLLFVGAVFLLSGFEQPHEAGQENLEETETKTKEELMVEKERKLADMKDEGKILIRAKRLSASKVKLMWENVDNDFIYYLYRKNTEGQKKLLGKMKNDSCVVAGLNKKKKYKFFVEIYYAWQGEINGQSVTENIYMGKSLTLTVITGGTHFMNVKRLQTKRESVTLQKKQMHSVRCRIWLNNDRLVYGPPKLYYYSTAPSVAKVDGSGCITAKRKGTAVIFVMAPNGVYNKVSVEVK